MENKNSCGLLIKQIHTTLEKNANNALRADDLTSAQVAVMMTLDEQREQCMTLKELEKKLMLAQSTIAGTVARLEAKGLISYSASKEDKRIKWVHLTEAGAECCRKSAQRMEETEERLLSGLTETEREIFISLLKKVNNAIK